MNSKGKMDQELGARGLNSHTALPRTTSSLLGSGSQTPGTPVPLGFPFPISTQPPLPTYLQPGHRHGDNQGWASASHILSGHGGYPRLAASGHIRWGTRWGRASTPPQSRHLVYLCTLAQRCDAPEGCLSAEGWNGGPEGVDAYSTSWPRTGTQHVHPATRRKGT